MKAAHLMSQSERRGHLEMSLTNAEYMLQMERDISRGKGWSSERIASALEQIPRWETRVAELKGLLKK